MVCEIRNKASTKNFISIKCVVFVIIALIVSVSCHNLGGDETVQDVTSTESQKQPEYRKVSPEEAKDMMSGEHIILDVRTDEEYKELRIDGALLIPDTEIAARAEEELTDKDILILVYCRSGRRSALAATELVNMGYTNV